MTGGGRNAGLAEYHAQWLALTAEPNAHLAVTSQHQQERWVRRLARLGRPNITVYVMARGIVGKAPHTTCHDTA